MAIQVQTTVTTEKEAVKSMADLIKNPPKNPVEMVKWVSKNFSVTGDILGTVGKFLGVGKALPMIGAIFDVFSSFTAPSVGEQIAQAVEQITSAIQAGVEEIKNALSFSTEKTISAVITEVQNISMEESATRVIQAMVESEILTETDATIKAMFDEYTQEVSKLNEQWQSEIMSALSEAQKQIDDLYAQIQDVLAALGIDLLQQLYDMYMKKTEAAGVAQSRELTTADMNTTGQPEITGTSGLILAAGAAAIFFFLQKKKR